MKRVLVPLAVGFEEAEFIGIADVLKRASAMSGNLELIIASLDSELWVKGANGIFIKAECSLESVELHSDKKIVAAICASPIVLNEAEVLSAEFACYPGCETGLKGQRLEKAVLVRDNVITGAGPATAILFGLELAKALCGEEIYKALYEGMLVPLIKA